MASSLFCLTGTARATFQSTFNWVDSSMLQLGGSIDAIQGVANSLGHTRISNKCSEARNHVNYARSGWGGIWSFNSSPWNARSSPHAETVKRRMSSCGSSLNWIWNQPEIRHPAYAPHINNCRNSYNQCQTGCTSVWNWSTPTNNNGPTPSGGYSGGYSRRYRKREESICPANETACPISDNSENHECLDTQSELSSCGGCVTLNDGENCLIIPGAQGVGCLQGKCVVFSVNEGYKMSEAGRPELIN